MAPKTSKMDGHDKSSELIIGGAFSQAHGLRDRVLDVARRHWQGGDPPGEIPNLLSDISRFILSLQTEGPPSDYPAPEPSQQNGAEHTSKKRKLDEPEGGKSTQTQFGGYDDYKPKTDYELKDVSFTAPLRKKMRLQFSHDPGNALKRQIRLIDSKTGSVEHILRGEDIEQMFMLPVPDKAQRQQNFLLFPRADAVSRDGSLAEPVLFTVNEIKGTPEVISSSTKLHGSEDETLVQTTLRELNIFMASLSLQVVTPAAEDFASEIPQSHRKGEKGYHVKAFKGSKEGYLFFLRNGIVFGFKKPLAFFPFASIESISFTSVLARTFNLVIATVTANIQSTEAQEEDVVRQEHEFSMIDIVEFGGIDTYIKTQGLNDASMAAERRAKILNVNKDKKGGDGATGGADGAAEGEEGGQLAKAEQMLQDQEDEEEEDYDPSEGESDGSGESSEEEEGYEDGDGEEMEEVEEEEG